MYSFYKVKSRRNQQEFRHPFFRRETPDDLKYIKRKNVNKRLKAAPETPVKEEPVAVSHGKVREQIEKLQGVLDFIAEQNKTLAQTNRNIVGQLYSSRGYCESQIREFIGLMFVSMSVPNTNLISDVRRYMANLEFDASSLPMPSLLDRNVVNADTLAANTGKVFNMQDAMDNLFAIYRKHITVANGSTNIEPRVTEIPAPVCPPATPVVSEPVSADKRPKRERPLLTLMPARNESAGPYGPFCLGERRVRGPMLMDSPLPVMRATRLDDKFSITLSPVKCGSNDKELAATDLLNSSFYRDNDVMSMCELVYSPISPLFREEF